MGNTSILVDGSIVTEAALAPIGMLSVSRTLTAIVVRYSTTAWLDVTYLTKPVIMKLYIENRVLTISGPPGVFGEATNLAYTNVSTMAKEMDKAMGLNGRPAIVKRTIVQARQVWAQVTERFDWNVVQCVCEPDLERIQRKTTTTSMVDKLGSTITSIRNVASVC